MTQRVVFVDREDVLNVDKGYVFKYEDWQWMPQAPQALKLLRQSGYHYIVLVTRQSGIGRYHFHEDDFWDLMYDVQRDIPRTGGYAYFDSVLMCPHTPESGCNCFVPSSWTFLKMAASLPGPVLISDNWLVSARGFMLDIGQEWGVKTVLIDKSLPNRPNPRCTAVCSSLHHFAQMLASRQQ